MIYKKIITIFTISSLSLIIGCAYSFSGASVPEHLETIHIPIFKDNSGSGEPNLSSTFTFEIIQNFIDDANLQVTESRESDAILECTITRFSDNPMAISGNESISMKKVTITVKALYRDLVLRKTIFEQDFSNFGEYENSGDITQNRKDAIQLAIDRVSEDILLKVVSDW